MVQTCICALCFSFSEIFLHQTSYNYQTREILWQSTGFLWTSTGVAFSNASRFDDIEPHLEFCLEHAESQMKDGGRLVYSTCPVWWVPQKFQVLRHLVHLDWDPARTCKKPPLGENCKPEICHFSILGIHQWGWRCFGQSYEVAK